MAFGCAFIFVVFLWLCRRKAKKRRAKRTAAFASTKGLDRKHSWRSRLIHFGKKLFGHSKKRRVVVVRHPNKQEGERVKLAELRDAEEARTSSDGLLKNDDDDMLELIASYQRRSASPRGARYDPSLHRISEDDVQSLNSHTAPSIFSHITGSARRAPDARQPVKEPASRFSDSTVSSGSHDHRRKPSGSKSNNPFLYIQ